jgi:hypothetical protein
MFLLEGMFFLAFGVEQSLEWNTSLFLNFVDFEKAFDSLDREVLWNLMAHYGIPQKFINIIRNSK